MFRYFAMNYKSKGSGMTIPWICGHNAEVAQRVGHLELQDLWIVLQSLLEAELPTLEETLMGRERGKCGVSEHKSDGNSSSESAMSGLNIMASPATVNLPNGANFSYLAQPGCYSN